MMVTSPAAKAKFYTLSNQAAKTISETRWYSWFEVANQIFHKWVDVKKVIQNDTATYAENLRQDLNRILSNESDTCKLKCQLALINC